MFLNKLLSQIMDIIPLFDYDPLNPILPQIHIHIKQSRILMIILAPTRSQRFLKLIGSLFLIFIKKK